MASQNSHNLYLASSIPLILVAPNTFCCFDSFGHRKQKLKRNKKSSKTTFSNFTNNTRHDSSFNSFSSSSWNTNNTWWDSNISLNSSRNSSKFWPPPRPLPSRPPHLRNTCMTLRWVVTWCQKKLWHYHSDSKVLFYIRDQNGLVFSK